MEKLFMCHYWVITLPQYKDLEFNNINEANSFRYKNNIPCKYQKRRKRYWVEKIV